MSRGDLLVVAGEASGDLHAARLLRGVLERRPAIRAFGLGSDELRALGVDLVADSREIAVVGIVEAWSVLARAREIFAALLAEVERRRLCWSIFPTSICGWRAPCGGAACASLTT
jgi:lipid-A-disaccharide synthase